MTHQNYIDELVGSHPDAIEPHPCRTPGCDALVTEAWEESVTLCATCAVEAELSDRYGRWERSFPPDWTPETFQAS